MSERSNQAQIIYIHGFNSSPDSEKAQIFSHYFYLNFPPSSHLSSHPNSPPSSHPNSQHNLDHSKNESSPVELIIPELPSDPEKAIVLLEGLIAAQENTFLVGNSLGGYYACYLAEKYELKAVLINPAVSPVKNLGPEFLGAQTNSYTGEEYELTMDHVDYLSTLDVEVLQYPENYLLLVQTGDELLDYRHAVERYAGAQQIVQEGGDHSFVNFEAVLPEIFAFFEIKV